jgi:D-alanyl-D-alanine carboxypeptidase
MRALAVVSAIMLVSLPAGQASLSAQVTAAPALPDTPAGRQFRTWLETFNSDDPAAFEAAMAREYPTWNAPPGATRGLREMTGGFTPVRVEAAEEGRITVLLEEKNWEGAFARITLDVEPKPDGKITAVQLQGTAPPPDRLPPARMSEAAALATLKAKLDTFSAAGQFAGAVKVARNGETVFDYASGQADRERGLPNTIDTLFRIGSMNKMFTAVSVLQLAQASKIDLDAPMGTYLKDYPNSDVASRVTVRHLLTHTGGTGDIFSPEFFQRREQMCSAADHIALYGTRDLAFAPGERYAYSNYGFVLLGAIVEAVSGQDYYDYVAEHVYRPAGMSASGSLPESDEVPGRSIGYTQQGLNGPRAEIGPNTDTLPCRGSAAGGGYSTVGDLVRFAEALRTGKLLEPQLLQAATTTQVEMGPGGGYGFGFGNSTVNGTRAYGHSGGAPGMSAELMVFPDLGYEVAIAANMDSQLVSRLARYIGERLPAPTS